MEQARNLPRLFHGDPARLSQIVAVGLDADLPVNIRPVVSVRTVVEIHFRRHVVSPVDEFFRGIRLQFEPRSTQSVHLAILGPTEARSRLLLQTGPVRRILSTTFASWRGRRLPGTHETVGHLLINRGAHYA